MDDGRRLASVSDLLYLHFTSNSTREGEPFTAVVDGANVAYFGFPELHYSQVKLVVDELRRIGENPLVVLPKKYTYPTFMLSSTSNSQKLTDRDMGVINRWVNRHARQSSNC